MHAVGASLPELDHIGNNPEPAPVWRTRDVAATGATLVVTSNTGCHLQLIAGVRKAGLNARVMHVVEVLDESYRREQDAGRR